MNANYAAYIDSQKWNNDNRQVHFEHANDATRGNTPVHHNNKPTDTNSIVHTTKVKYLSDIVNNNNSNITGNKAFKCNKPPENDSLSKAQDKPSDPNFVHPDLKADIDNYEL